MGQQSFNHVESHFMIELPHFFNAGKLGPHRNTTNKMPSEKVPAASSSSKDDARERRGFGRKNQFVAASPIESPQHKRNA
jgi:hypothetical protein